MRSSIVAAAAMAGANLAGLAATPAAADFSLAGKNVQVLLAGGVGGGLDLYARVFLPYLSKYLPGKPTMVIQNMPGGGGLQGVQNLYNIAPKDGTAIGTTPAGPVKEPLMGSGKVNYDLRKFAWIGSLTIEDTMCLVWHASKVTSLADAKARVVPISATGAASNSTLGPLLMNDLIGTRWKPISGYDGGTSMLAVERGEVEGRCTTLNSVRVAQPRWIGEKLVRGIVSFSNASDPAFPGVPNLKSLLKNDADRIAFEFFQTPDEIQNPYYLPPGAAPEVVTAYRKAFDDAIKDPEYRADAEKRVQNVVPHSGAEVQARIEAMYATPPAIIERVKKATTVTASEEKQ